MESKLSVISKKWKSRPQLVGEINGADWSIYLAKDFFKSKWYSKELKQAVILCRQNFRRYGDVPELDAYDKKSQVWLTRVKYQDREGAQKEEWFSLRYISVVGTPEFSDDFKIGLATGINYSDLIIDKIYHGKKAGLKKVFTISRICAYNPDDAGGINKFNFTQLATALTLEATIKKNRWSHDKAVYLTGMFNQHLFKHLVCFKQSRKPTVLAWPLAYKTLNLDNNLFHNLRVGELGHKLPNYFLDLEELVSFIDKLLKRKKISIKTLKFFLGKNFDSANLTRQLRLKRKKIVFGLTKLGSMFVYKGKLPEAELTGEELRQMIDKEVSHAIVLTLVAAKELTKNIHTTFRQLKINL